jgi:teichuronic acid biosynthesis glycosyltransferase TuaH
LDDPGQRDARAPEAAFVLYAPTAWDSPWQPAHNLAHALASRSRVLYVDPPLSPLTPIRYGLRASSRSQLASVAKRAVRRSGRVSVFSPLAFPPVANPRAARLSRPLVRAQVSRAVAASGLAEPVVLAWRGLPDLTGAAGERLRVAVVMDHPAGGAALLGRAPEDLDAETERLCSASGAVITTSGPVQRLMAERGVTSELVRFGFPADLADVYARAPEPDHYRALPRPIIGYTGGIDDRLDYGLIAALADRFEDATLVFVGAMSPRLSDTARAALASRPNIRLLGPRPREELPGYVRWLDVALLPYSDTLFTRYQSPMKLWEYLAAGPPIVATGSPDLEELPPQLVSYVQDASGFPGAVAAALREPDGGGAHRREFAMMNTWEHRAAEIERIVGPGAAQVHPERGR